jgi:hypothetical protein
MTVWVIRNGILVEKGPAQVDTPTFPRPTVSRMAPFDSPVTGKEISSWRERDRDMAAAGAVDPRDLPRQPFEKRRVRNERSRRAAAPE